MWISFKDFTLLENPEIYCERLVNCSVYAIGFIEYNSFSQKKINQEIVDSIKQCFLKDCYVSPRENHGCCQLCNTLEEAKKTWPRCREDDDSISIHRGYLAIPFGENKYYLAPSLIYHFMKKHAYYPPKEFLDAVYEFIRNE